MIFFRKIRSWITGTYPTKTGKRTRKKGYITAFGERRGINMEVFTDGTVLCTLKEAESMAIQCALCENPIFPGEAIILYSLQEGHVAPAHAVPHKSKDETYYIGCTGWDCATSGGYMYGHWVPDMEHPGTCIAQKYMSEADIFMQHPEAEAIIINNFNSPFPDVQIF